MARARWTEDIVRIRGRAVDTWEMMKNEVCLEIYFIMFAPAVLCDGYTAPRVRVQALVTFNISRGSTISTDTINT